MEEVELDLLLANNLAILVFSKIEHVQKIYSQTEAIGAVFAERDARKHENLRFTLFFSKSQGTTRFQYRGSM